MLRENYAVLKKFFNMKIEYLIVNKSSCVRWDDVFEIRSVKNRTQFKIFLPTFRGKLIITFNRCSQSCLDTRWIQFF